MVLSSVQKSLLRTLLYSDIFDFPLTEDELVRGLITDGKVSREDLREAVAGMKGIVVFRDGYFCLKRKEKIIEERISRKNITRKKLFLAKTYARILSQIPTVLFVGITGRLSHNDSFKEDDIDFFIIVRKNTIWITRLAIVLALELFRVRRRVGEEEPSDKICVNLIVEESALAWAKNKRDLYIAHEITHVIPVLDRDNIYKRFLDENNWIKKFFANFSFSESQAVLGAISPSVLMRAVFFVLNVQPIERLAGKLQKLYMKKRVTTETVQDNFLAFHPRDMRLEIIGKYRLKLREFAHFFRL